ncbi:MAG: CRTAC1 family protein [Bryobacter sp.]|nr:CRTAC1 family protein [Bryobacter sp.]
MRAGWGVVVLCWFLASCGQTTPDKSAGPWFEEVAAQAGLDFRHDPGLSGRYYLPEIMGAGGALFDYDNDGDLDIFLVQSKGPHQLFRNDTPPGGQLRFRNESQALGGASGYGMGAAVSDVDGDGNLDLYVTQLGGNLLLRNLGNGIFLDISQQSGTVDPRWSTSATFADYDRDGRPDLFVLNYVDFTPENHVECRSASGAADYCTPRAYRPVAASLYRNLGEGRFADKTVSAGMNAAKGPGLGVVALDANDDGWLDFFVANDSMANLLWVNNGKGGFREQALTAGLAYSEDGVAKAGMGVAIGDFDNDADDDVLVANLTREGATLFRRDGPLGYFDNSLVTRTRRLSFDYTGFGAGWADFDQDGWLELFVANGAVTIQQDQAGSAYPFRQKNLLLRNDLGKELKQAVYEGGAALDLEEVSRGALFGDLDQDGDLDVVVTNNNGPVRLLRNVAPQAGAWLQVQLEPEAALPARVGVELPNGTTLWRRAHRDGSYLGSDDPAAHFGLGLNKEYRRIHVLWPDGQRSTYDGGPCNRRIKLSRK